MPTGRLNSRIVLPESAGRVLVFGARIDEQFIALVVDDARRAYPKMVFLRVAEATPRTWRAEVRRLLHDVDHVVAFARPDGELSPHVQWEIDEAQRLDC